MSYKKETDIVLGMKLALIANPEPKGDRLCFTFKLSRDRHAKLLAAADKHDMTLTDLFRLHVDRLLPVLQKATPVDVPGYKKDGRTKPKRRNVHVYREP